MVNGFATFVVDNLGQYDRYPVKCLACPMGHGYQAVWVPGTKFPRVSLWLGLFVSFDEGM